MPGWIRDSPGAQMAISVGSSIGRAADFQSALVVESGMHTGNDPVLVRVEAHAPKQHLPHRQ